MIETVENVPVQLNLMSYVNVTGWRLQFGKATKEPCTGGFISSRGARLEQAYYNVKYVIDSVSGGVMDVWFGGVKIGSHSVPGTYTYRSKAINSEIKVFAGIGVSGSFSRFEYKKEVTDNNDSYTTLAFSEPIDKWTSFYTFSPDYGFSLKRNLFTVKDGALWMHDVKFTRNKFYGIQYDSTVEFPINAAVNDAKTYKNIAIRSDKLLVTTEDGIKTSLGQISDLLAEDFRRYILSDGTNSISVYDREGVYVANFLRDKNTDLINGDFLKGSTITIKLTTTDDKNFKLFSVYINVDASLAGI